jgi:hypothetical protein
LGPLRNKVVHGIWAKTDDPDMAMVSAVKSGWKLKFQSEYMNEVYLAWLEREIMTLMSALFGFGQEFGIVGQR